MPPSYEDMLADSLSGNTSYTPTYNPVTAQSTSYNTQTPATAAPTSTTPSSSSAPAPTLPSNPMGDPSDYYGSRGRAVAGWYRQYLGRDYDEDGYRGYVNGQLTLQQIEDAIKGSSEAKSYASGGTSGAGAGTGGSGTGGEDWKTGAWDADRVRRYFQSRGVTPNASSPDYWAQKWKEFGERDPEYFLRYLSNAEEFSGGSQQTAQSMWGSGAGGGGREFNDPWGSQLESLVSQYLGNTRQRATDIAKQYRTRAEELRQPAYTTAEDQAIRTKAFDQLERRRAETKKNSRESVYLRGFAPTSGLAAGADQEVDRNFENVRGTIESNLTQSAINETQRRRDAALQLEALATEALNGGDLGAIQATGLPLSLMTTRQSAAQQAYNSTGNPLSSILAILAAAQSQQGNQNAANSNNAAGLGNYMAWLSDLLGGR